MCVYVCVFFWDRSYLLLEASDIDFKVGMDPLNKVWCGRKKSVGKILKKWPKQAQKLVKWQF